MAINSVHQMEIKGLFDADLSGSQCEPDGDKQCASNGNKKEEFILNTFCGNFLGQYLMLLYLARSVSQMAIYSVHQI